MSHLQTTLRLTAGETRSLCRLGLATRGDSELTVDDVERALDCGVNFLNWCGTPDELSDSIANLGKRREDVIICAQFEARTATEASQELPAVLKTLGTDRVDVLTFYYVEEASEWEQIRAAGGALEYCQAAKRDGVVGLIGLTSHQRKLAGEIARSGQLDILMLRYNAAHRGAETDVFPVTDSLGLPVVVYTCLRWGALLRSTPDDPPGFVVPAAPMWYRFALQSSSVTVALMAPNSRAELEEDLSVLRAKRPLSEEEYARLAEHGQRVRKNAGSFP
jgi:predicted aldo/keto reductase-like oxidoreductase